MAILLLSDASAGATIPELIGAQTSDAPIVLLCAGDGASTATALAQALLPLLPNLFVVDVNGDRFARLNFDALRAVILDFDVETLLASAGRRLVEVLAQLAAMREAGDELHLVFVGATAGTTGGVLLDGIHAGLNLIPATAVAPDIKAVADLRGLIMSMSAGRGRLIALDAPVGLAYSRESDQVQVAGKGSALLVAFVPSNKGSQAARDHDPSDSQEPPPPTARLHVVTGGMRSAFPDS
jgi:hypothetical protein